jgi:methyl-accepting chemotaxis protein
MRLQLKIGTKIAASFGIVIALIMIMAINSFISLGNAKSDLEKIDEANNRMALADDIAVEYKAAVGGLRGYVAYGDEAYLGKAETSFEQVLKLEKELLDMARPDKKQSVQELIDATTQYKNGIATEFKPLAKQYNTAVLAGDGAKAAEYKKQLGDYAKKVAPQASVIETAIDGFSNTNAEVAKGSSKRKYY